MPSDNLSPKIIADLLHKSRILHSNHFIRINIAAVAPVHPFFRCNHELVPCHYPATRPHQEKELFARMWFLQQLIRYKSCSPACSLFPSTGTNSEPQKCSFVHSISLENRKNFTSGFFSDLCDRAMVVIQITDSAKQRLIGGCEVIAPSDVDTHRLAGLHLLLHRCRFFCQSKISECECFPHLLFDIGKIPFRLKISQQQGWLAPQYLRIVIARRFPVGQILPAAQQPPGTMEGLIQESVICSYSCFVMRS